MDKFNKDKKIILNTFNKMIKDYGIRPKGLGWGSKNSQYIRFETLSEIGDLNTKTILDVGCGFGDFYGFLLKNKKIKLKRYFGIDINPLMITIAKKKYPRTEFEVNDLLEVSLPKSFDYVVESGIFNLKVPNWEKLTTNLLTQMYKASKIGVGANFLNSFSAFKKDKNSYYVDSSKILKFINNNLTAKVILRQDYKSNDFTVFFYKDK